MTDNMTAGEAISARSQADGDERSLHRRVQWFVEKWTTALDLNKRDAGEFAADFTLVVQAVHRDASRETHALLAKSLAAMPPTFIVGKPKD